VVEKAKTEELQDIKNKYVKAEPFFKKEAKPKISKKNNKNPAKGYWCCNCNPIVAKAIFAERLKKIGYLNILDYNESVCI